MYLSRLEIQGFKSFAQRVGLAIDSGISAIVGPNGCGKTNIVDAIRWVLGEERYSALRSDKMEEVIFNGTKARKAVGMAEASLVIENTRGILPSEYSQVTIGRRVYRSGASEYFLNKTPVRLRDVRDMFYGTGMGSHAYSVIERAMVDHVLSDASGHRRFLFEEASARICSILASSSAWRLMSSWASSMRSSSTANWCSERSERSSRSTRSGMRSSAPTPQAASPISIRWPKA